MKTFYIQIKCELGKTYDVANLLVEKNIAAEIHSIAGPFDIIAKFHVDDDVDIGCYVTENIQSLPLIRDTLTTMAFKAFI